MSQPAAHNPTDLLAPALALGDLLDATSLAELLASFYALFRLPVRVLNERGALLARTRSQAALNEYLGELPVAGQLLNTEHQELRVRDLGADGELLHRAFTGASYHVGAIGHEGRSIGRFILGPFRTPDAAGLPGELTACDPALDVARVSELLEALPRVRQDTVKAIARHLSVTLDALIYAGYRAKLSEHMHLSSVQENGRQLSEAGQRLRAEEHQREESRRAAGRLLGAVSAELAEPARIILQHASRVGASSPREQSEAVSSVRHEAERLMDLAGRLLQLSDMESGSALHRQEVEPGALLERIRAALARSRDARVELVLEADLPRLWCDPARLGDALRLLAENALDVQPDGAIRLEARRAQDSGPQAAELDGLVLMGGPPEVLELRVVDRGPNLTDRERESARGACDDFGPERADAARSGLRLAVVKRLVDAHGGTLRVEDNAPQGAVFVITLPLSGHAG